MKARHREAFAAAGTPGPAAVASYLGLSLAQLRRQLATGRSLVQIAAGRGKSTAGLEAAVLADVEAHLDLLLHRAPTPLAA